ncbi:MAG: hypothetical protein WCO71_12990, partial [Pseudomonadota bacterium]
IPGWQSAESHRYHLSPVLFDAQWLEEAQYNIKITKNLRVGLVMTAGYISDLLDFLIEKNHDEDARSNYSEYCSDVIQSISAETDDGAQIAVFCWKIAQLILEAYETCHGMNDWELYEYLESVLPTEDKPDEDKEGALFEVFRGCLCLLHGWINEENRTDSSVSTK